MPKGRTVYLTRDEIAVVLLGIGYMAESDDADEIPQDHADAARSLVRKLLGTRVDVMHMSVVPIPETIVV